MPNLSTFPIDKDYKLTDQRIKSPFLIFSFLFHFSGTFIATTKMEAKAGAQIQDNTGGEITEAQRQRQFEINTINNLIKYNTNLITEAQRQQQFNVMIDILNAGREARRNEIGNLFQNGINGLENPLLYSFYKPSNAQPKILWQSSSNERGWKIRTNPDSKARIHYDSEGEIYGLERSVLEDTSLDGIISLNTIFREPRQGPYLDDGLKLKVSECKPAFIRKVPGDETKEVYIVYTLKYFWDLFFGFEGGPPAIAFEFPGKDYRRVELYKNYD